MHDCVFLFLFFFRLSLPLKVRHTHTQIYKITQNKRLNGSTSKSTSLIGRQFIFLFFSFRFSALFVCAHVEFTWFIQLYSHSYFYFIIELCVRYWLNFYLYIFLYIIGTHIIIVILVSYTFDDGR